MTEIRLVKRYPHIKEEDVTSIFQEGYIKGFENGRKGAILIEWARAYMNELNKQAEKEWEYVLNELGGYEPCYCEMYARGIKHLIEDWEKENESRKGEEKK